MKLINKTDIKSDQLRNLIKEVAKRELVDLKDATFTIVNKHIGCHGAYIGGWAYYGLPARVRLKIPKNIPVDKVELAYVVAHELCHVQGLSHNKMRNSVYSRRYAVRHGGDWRQPYLYAQDIPIEREAVQVATPIPKDIIIQQKRDKCLKMVFKWQNKIKSANNIHKKWRRKFMYYEAKLSKAACIPTEKA